MRPVFLSPSVRCSSQHLSRRQVFWLPDHPICLRLPIPLIETVA